MRPDQTNPLDLRTPVILVSGIAEEPMATATIGMQWDLPSAVVVRHEIDPEREMLIRTVSDARGLLERIEISVEHACVGCAIREDVVPTLERLAVTGQWGAIIAQLPVTAEANQVCRVLGYEPRRRPAPTDRRCIGRHPGRDYSGRSSRR